MLPDGDTSIIDYGSMRVVQKGRNIFKLSGNLTVNQNMGPEMKARQMVNLVMEYFKIYFHFRLKWITCKNSNQQINIC